MKLLYNVYNSIGSHTTVLYTLLYRPLYMHYIGNIIRTMLNIIRNIRTICYYNITILKYNYKDLRVQKLFQVLHLEKINYLGRNVIMYLLQINANVHMLPSQILNIGVVDYVI